MILLILILGLGFRLMSLNQSLWLDEATSALVTKMSVTDFFGQFMPGDFHPPLYYLVLRLWSAFFGTSEAALRSMSVVFGVASVYLVYLIGKKLVSKNVGIVAALLLATSGLHIYYSQEVRMYSLGTLVVVFAIFSYVKILEKESRVGDWVILAVSLGMMGMTDYILLLVLPIFWIYGFLEKKTTIWFKRLFTSHIILGVLGVLWLPIFIKQLTSGISITNSSPAWVSVLGIFSVKNILLVPVKFIVGRIGFEDRYVYALIVGFALFVFGAIGYKCRKYLRETKLIYLWMFVPLGIAFLVSAKLPILNYFRFLFVLPSLYLILAIGISGCSIKWRRVFLVLVAGINVITSLIYLTNQKFWREDWRATVAYIENNRMKNSVVVFPANSQMEAYRYYSPAAFLYGSEGVNTYTSEIWYIRYAQEISDPSDSTRKKIEHLEYKKINEFDFNGVLVWEYNNLE